MRSELAPISVARLDDARAELRSHIDVELAVMGKIASLPEDDFCHFSRESFQHGAAYAFTRVEDTSGPEAFVIDDQEVPGVIHTVIDAFLCTRPQNKYLSPHQQQSLRHVLEHVAILLLLGEPIEYSHLSGSYEIEAFLAFVDGYQLVTRSVTHNQH